MEKGWELPPPPSGGGFDTHYHARRTRELGFLIRHFEKVLAELGRAGDLQRLMVPGVAEEPRPEFKAPPASDADPVTTAVPNLNDSQPEEVDIWAEGEVDESELPECI